MRFRIVLFLGLASVGSAASFRFAIVGDRTGRAQPGIYEETWREVAASHPDFVITVGDAIEGLNSRTALSEWTSVRKNWPPGLRVYHTAGNHDIWDAASEALYVEETGRAPFYSFDFQGAHFTVLDNSRTEALSPEQLRFLESDLRSVRSPGPRFVFFHRPFWLLPLKLQAPELRLQTLARQYGVCCVISGHGHQFQSIQHEGVLYLEVGSSGATLAGAGPAGIGYAEGWFYQYAWVTVADGKASFEIRELQPPYGQRRTQRFQATAP